MGSRCRIDVNSLEDAIMIMFTTRGTTARIMAQGSTAVFFSRLSVPVWL
jgi:hypothetical protein